jgi:UDP-N-acetyl-2-amino-2-deoxyglucuronate dehydrogenase
MYSAIHGVDRLRWLLGGEVVSVSAQARGLGDDSEVEAAIAALLTFDNGAVASLIACAPLYHAQPAHWETEIYGTLSLARLRTRSFAELSNDGVMIRLETHSADSALGPHYNFARQARAFADAIEQDSEPVITGEDGLRVLEICLAIYQAAESGKIVEMRNS